MFKKLLVFMLALMLAVGTLVGCSSSDSDSSDSDDSSDTVTLAYVNWSDAIAITYVAAAVLEDELGYDVELTEVDAGVAFSAVADGSADAFLDAWLPNTHADYLEEYGDDMLDLGELYTGAQCGLVVPSYVYDAGITSISDLEENADLFDGTIVGIDAGAGIMTSAEETIEAYGLDSFTLQTSSSTAMTAALADAIDSEDYIVVTGWAPHWMFAEWDLEFLEDDQESMGGVEYVEKYGRLDLDEDMPEVAEFLENFTLDSDTLAVVMDAIYTADATEEDDIYTVVREWLADNEDLVSEWVSE